MTTKANILEELKGMHLTKVIGRKPNALDVNNWEEKASKIVPSINMNLFPGGQVDGHLAIVILEEEEQLEIDDDTFM